MVIVNEETERQFFQVIENIGQINTPNIDGKIISNILRLCYLCALKKGELINLNIENFTEKGGVVLDEIKLGSNLQVLSKPVKRLIDCHYKYLGKNRYKRYRKSPLFPAKTGQRYKSRKLQNHIDQICLKFNVGLGLEKIRQYGIYKSYKGFLNQGKSREEALSLAGRFGRLNSEKHIQNLINKIYREESLLDDHYSRYWKQIENFQYLPSKNRNSIIENKKNEIESHTELNEEQKATLLKKIAKLKP
jgi:hypothetical protein